MDGLEDVPASGSERRCGGMASALSGVKGGSGKLGEEGAVEVGDIQSEGGMPARGGSLYSESAECCWCWCEKLALKLSMDDPLTCIDKSAPANAWLLLCIRDPYACGAPEPRRSLARDGRSPLENA